MGTYCSLVEPGSVFGSFVVLVSSEQVSCRRVPVVVFLAMLWSRSPLSRPLKLWIKTLYFRYSINGKRLCPVLKKS